MGITTGTLDEGVLLGERREGCDEDGGGRGTGKELASPEAGHLWFGNAIGGVTDEVRVGRKFVEGMDGKVIE